MEKKKREAYRKLKEYEEKGQLNKGIGPNKKKSKAEEKGKRKREIVLTKKRIE